MHIEAFYDYMRSVRRLNTAKKYAHGAQKFLEFLASNGVRFDRMPANILSLYSEYLVHAKMRPASVVVYVAAAKRFLEWTRHRGEHNIQISSVVDLPKVVKLPPNALKQDHIVAYLALAAREPEPRRTALLLLPFCGLRTFELLNLTYESLTKVSVALDRSKPDDKKDLLCLTVEGKGGEHRVVPILPDGIGILVSYLKHWRNKIPRGGRFLFVHPNGEKLSDRTLRDVMVRFRRKLGLQGRFTLHTLRRTYLNTLRRAGVDIATLTKIAGHKSFQTTMAHYLEIVPEDVANAVGASGARLVERSPYAEQVDQASHDVLAFLKNRNPGDSE
jgi:integrase/recombinase XerC/integrase/recombinase XerD